LKKLFLILILIGLLLLSTAAAQGSFSAGGRVLYYLEEEVDSLIFFGPQAKYNLTDDIFIRGSYLFASGDYDDIGMINRMDCNFLYQLNMGIAQPYLGAGISRIGILIFGISFFDIIGGTELSLTDDITLFGEGIYSLPAGMPEEMGSIIQLSGGMSFTF